MAREIGAPKGKISGKAREKAKQQEKEGTTIEIREMRQITSFPALVRTHCVRGVPRFLLSLSG